MSVVCTPWSIHSYWHEASAVSRLSCTFTHGHTMFIYKWMQQASAYPRENQEARIYAHWYKHCNFHVETLEWILCALLGQCTHVDMSRARLSCAFTYGYTMCICKWMQQASAYPRDIQQARIYAQCCLYLQRRLLTDLAKAFQLTLVSASLSRLFWAVYDHAFIARPE